MSRQTFASRLAFVRDMLHTPAGADACAGAPIAAEHLERWRRALADALDAALDCAPMPESPTIAREDPALARWTFDVHDAIGDARREVRRVVVVEWAMTDPGGACREAAQHLRDGEAFGKVVRSTTAAEVTT